jgi:predicted RNase H-like HicB family nuclease
MKSAIVVEIELPANLRQENEWWIANCPALDVCSQGPSREAALVNLEDAVAFFVESCFERGTLFEVLREAGFERVSEEQATAPILGLEEDALSVRVPLPFVISQRVQGTAPAQQR